MTAPSGIDDILVEAVDKMSKAVGHTQAEFSAIRTGRATPALVEKLRVDFLAQQEKKARQKK